MAAYKTPGVYIEEISTLPASIVQVETAIPAFIGYTARAERKGRPLRNTPTRIRSLLEFRDLFGDGPKLTAEVTFDDDKGVTKVVETLPFLMFDSIRLFFMNGGSDCYIVSVGDSGTGGPKLVDLQAGLAATERMDEPTLLLFPDAVRLTQVQLQDLQTAALAQANKLQDRFCIFDLLSAAPGDDADLEQKVSDFRDGIGSRYLKYGAAYVPWIRTSLDKDVRARTVQLKNAAGADRPLESLSTDPQFRQAVASLTAAAANVDKVSDYETKGADGAPLAPAFGELITKLISTAKAAGDGAADPAAATAATLAAAKAEVDKVIDLSLKALTQVHLWCSESSDSSKQLANGLATDVSSLIKGKGSAVKANLLALNQTLAHNDHKLATAPANARYVALVENKPWRSDQIADPPYSSIGDAGDDLLTIKLPVTVSRLTRLSRDIMALLEDLLAGASTLEQSAVVRLRQVSPTWSAIVVATIARLQELPPSGAIAGIYAAVDKARGVWKAPANVSLNGVQGLSHYINNDEQEGLNVDAVAGKSVNAIRYFHGKGNLVWGARTLAGNDQEWRYINVRRFYNMVEESVAKATAAVVFENNDAITWTRVRTMVSNFLTGLWRDGALMGAKPEDAYFVNVGLGTTMTANDVLDGRMIIEIGMAAVRPAEFIILRFMHKLIET